jgi:hypothetical protein
MREPPEQVNQMPHLVLFLNVHVKTQVRGVRAVERNQTERALNIPAGKHKLRLFLNGQRDGAESLLPGGVLWHGTLPAHRTGPAIHCGEPLDLLTQVDG